MSRRPVTTSQTSHAAKPATPANTSGEPSAMARFPAPAKMSTLPPATASSRCHGRVNPLAWVASAAPMKVAPSAGSASAKSGVELPDQLEGGGWLGQTIRGEHDRDVRGYDEGEYRRERRSGCHREPRPVRPCGAAALHEPLQPRDEQQEQGQVQGLQTHGDGQGAPVLGVVGEDLTKRRGVGGRSSEHRVLNDHRRG